MDLYQEIILDHYKHPHNQGTFTNESEVAQAAESNVGCGDEFQVSLQMDGDLVKDIRWIGQGCAISTASMSALSDEVKGKTKQKIQAMTKNNLLELLGMDEINPGREKCLMLGLKAVQRVINL